MRDAVLVFLFVVGLVGLTVGMVMTVNSVEKASWHTFDRPGGEISCFGRYTELRHYDFDDSCVMVEPS